MLVDGDGGDGSDPRALATLPSTRALDAMVWNVCLDVGLPAFAHSAVVLIKKNHLIPDLNLRSDFLDGLDSRRHGDHHGAAAGQPGCGANFHELRACACRGRHPERGRYHWWV